MRRGNTVERDGRQREACGTLQLLFSHQSRCECVHVLEEFYVRYIQTVTAHNFKSFREFQVAFDPGFNVICGTNGAGKSNLLDAIGFAFGEVWGTCVLASCKMLQYTIAGLRCNAPHQTFFCYWA